MLGSRDRPSEVTCIACGATVARADAREYDKYGDRFDRVDKEFEHLCKPCHRDANHQPRGDLEEVLADSGAGTTSRSEFLTRYAELSTDQGTTSERER